MTFPNFEQKWSKIIRASPGLTRGLRSARSPRSQSAPLGAAEGGEVPPPPPAPLSFPALTCLAVAQPGWPLLPAAGREDIGQRGEGIAVLCVGSQPTLPFPRKTDLDS